MVQLRSMGPLLFGLLWLLAWLAASAPLSAASFSLSPEEIREAVRSGQESVTSEDFGKEWQLANPNGESVMITTPFQRLALAARNAAFKKETLTPRQIEAILKTHEGKLLVWARLRGSRADFARWYQSVLLVSGREEIQPSFVQNERTALRLENGQYQARCLYSFPADSLPPEGLVTLLIRDRDSKEVSRFMINLATIR